jgi:nucleoside-diphosphate-sugar epimerase
MTGVDGYLGWPALIRFAKVFNNDRLIAVDNFARRRWVTEMGARSAFEIPTMDERLQRLHTMGCHNISFIDSDLRDYTVVKDLVASYQPEVVVHMAAQPSAPYSHINADKAAYTQHLNMAMTRNLLWALRENNLLKTHFIETTTTGIYGAPSFMIPEGAIVAMDADGKQDRIPYPNMASSWYHVSKGFNATNMQLMQFQTGMPTTDIRTSIIYGIDTQETKQDTTLTTRFDFDFYFGTLFNRWCAMAVIDHPLTVYGSGNQIKPFIHLDDAVESLVQAVIKGNPGEYRVFNQLTEYVRIIDLAQMIVDYLQAQGRSAAIEKIANPRVEKEEQEYRFENSGFLELLGREPLKMKTSVGDVLDKLLPHQALISGNQDRMFA